MEIKLNEKKKNNALEYLPKMKSNYDLVSPFYNDIKYTLYNGCKYYPNMLCAQHDFTIFNKIKEDLFKEENIIHWSKHHKIDNPTLSTIFNNIIESISRFFNIIVLQTRLNYYTYQDWKPFHHDSHAYTNKMKEDITIGCSLGSSRNLTFKHVESNIYFNFPQNNGDIFCFDYDTNIKFQHGISKLKS